MAKQKKRVSKKSSKVLVYIAWILVVIVLMLISLALGYYLGYENTPSTNYAPKEKGFKITPHKKIHKEVKSLNTQLKDVLIKRQNLDITAKHEYADEHLSKPPKAAERKIVKLTSKPKLAIIIDDVSLKSQVRAVRALGLNLTMSFFPPRPARPNSAKLAAQQKFYMVHLPLEALHFTAEEPNTLRISDSQKKISKRIRYIKRIFPRVRYINNHTGSKFTSNEKAMTRLIYALKANHINFIDSRTTAQTKAPIVMKKFGLKYVARDVFLDDNIDEASIIKQIKKAIKVAKLHGTAIAIGHPHKATLAALRDSKKLFKSVDLVQVYKIY